MMSDATRPLNALCWFKIPELTDPRIAVVDTQSWMVRREMPPPAMTPEREAELIRTVRGG